MNYILVELQTTNDVTAVVTPEVYTDRDTAESQFHLKASYAAMSQVEIHTVTLLTDDGRIVRSEYYRHTIPQPESQPEQEQE